MWIEENELIKYDNVIDLMQISYIVNNRVSVA
jgi:hypothetical protein